MYIYIYTHIYVHMNLSYQDRYDPATDIICKNGGFAHFGQVLEGQNLQQHFCNGWKIPIYLDIKGDCPLPSLDNLDH